MSFWEAPWLDVRKSKDFASLIFSISKMKSWNVNQAMKNKARIGKLNSSENVYLEHLAYFFGVLGSLEKCET
jgi:hypothetical protein